MKCSSLLKRARRSLVVRSAWLAVAATLVCSGAAITAQDLSNLSPDQIQQLMKNATPQQLQQLRRYQQQKAAQPGGADPADVPPQTTVLTPAEPRQPQPAGNSRLETAFSDRTGQRLQQFGYDQVGVGANVSVPQTGAVQDDYVLGPGDELVVQLRGQENSEFRAEVDRNGRVALPKTGPILAAGKTLGEFRQDFLAAVRRSYVSTEAYVSVGQLRQVTVMVAGEVANPGMRILTGLSNPLDAILLSGGVKKSGSLRAIKLIRGSGTIDVDLYGVLAKHGRSGLVNLRDGDRIFVPPIGGTVAVAGYVRRPAIYELPAGQSAVSAGELISLAAGPVMRGSATVSVLRIMPDGRGQFEDVTGQTGTLVRDGEVVVVKSAVDISVGRVTLEGAVRTPGVFAVERYKTLHSVLSSTDALQPGAYVLFGFIDRINRSTLQHEAIAFSPLRVVQGREDLNLASDDTIHILTFEDVQKLLAPDAAKLTGTANAGNQAATSAGISATASADAAAAPSAEGGDAGTAAPAAAVAGEAATAAGSTGQAGVNFGKRITDYRFSIFGAVHKPGNYLAAQGTTLADVLSVVGGLAQDADLSSFEVTSTLIDNRSGVSTTSRKQYAATDDVLKALIVNSFDRFEFRHVFSDRESGVVMVEGEVRYPGQYNILRAERLSSVMARAGGLTDVAYPYGTVFLRAEVAEREGQMRKKQVADIRNQLFEAMVRPASSSPPPSAESVIALQNLLTQIEAQPVLGRISIAADPAVLAANPDKDPVLQPGDRIVIPKRPSSVSVLGEVMQPGSFPFDKEMSVEDYLGEAGGFTEFADRSRVIVVLPDGRARLASKSWFNVGGSDDLPPGSVILVARDVTGITMHQFIIDTTQIFSQLATTAAALAVLATR